MNNILKEKIIERKDEIFEYIDNLELSDKSYYALMDLMDKMDDRLFIKLMDEAITISKDDSSGMNVFNDFISVLSNSLNRDSMEKSLKSQNDLYNEYTKLLAYIKTFSQYSVIESLPGLGVTDTIYTSIDGALTNTSINDIEKRNIAAGILSATEYGDSLTNFYANAVLRNIGNYDTVNSFIENLVLSPHEYIIPVDPQHILITDADKAFMAKEGISEDEMRKIKSLAVFDAVKWNSEGK